MANDKICVDCGSLCIGLRCRSCSNKHKGKLSSLRAKVDIESVTVNLQDFTATDASGNRVPTKMKFPFACVLCHKKYYASICFEKGKKHPWHCKSCAIHLEWSKEDYYDKHVETIKKVYTCEKHRERLGRLSRENWSNPEKRAAMMNRDFSEISKKSRATLMANLLSGKTVYRVTHGKRCLHGGVYMRSSYEQRFAAVLDSLGLEWEYEPKHFAVLNHTKTYLPDFFIPKLELYVEVKGWWRDDAKEKFDAWTAEYPQLNRVIIDKPMLELLECKEKELEACVFPSSG